jgi:hypothetical protein
LKSIEQAAGHVHNLKMFNFPERDKKMNVRETEQVQTAWLSKAAEALQASTGIDCKVVAGRQQDGSMELAVNGSRRRYHCEFKSRIPRFAMLEELRTRPAFDDSMLLVTPSMSQVMALRCRAAGIQFIDMAGNAYLSDGGNLFIFVAGLKADAIDVPIEASSLTTPAALRMILAFLVKPELLNASYREISFAAKVSTGAIGSVFNSLAARSFLTTTKSGRRLQNQHLLLGEWTAGYANRLRPKLERLRFAVEDTARLQQWQPTPGIAVWGGEMAAAMLTKHLKPQQFTIYLDMHAPRALTDLVKYCKLRKDNKGTIEVVQSFWEIDALQTEPGTAPLPLIYADLLVSGDPRNIEVASLLLKQMNHA